MSRHTITAQKNHGKVALWCVWLLSMFCLNATGEVLEPVNRRTFSLDNVRITDGPFFHAQQTNVKYLLALDPDRLLVPYLREAGLTPKTQSYGNWENTGLDGHIGGHYLSALSLSWAATGQQPLKSRLDYMIAELAKAQAKNGGYLGGVPDGRSAWLAIKKGHISADLFSLNERWVPLYNIDKIYHGLRDAYILGKNQQARQMLIEMGDWMIDLTADLTDKQVQQMLYSEHGGLAEVFVDIGEISGEQRFITMARRLAHLKIVDPLLAGRDELTGLHANTQIPKVIGMARIAQATGDTAGYDGARFFWRTVTTNRSVSIGGNSVREHFHDPADFTSMIDDAQGPETCNTYNMLKLSELLYLHYGDPEYLAFYERATYNHILSSQHPDHGGLVYFTSMRPGHYRKYSSVDHSMWCCVGSGIENHSKYGELIYTRYGDDLEVNFFIPSKLQWREKGIILDQQTLFPDENSVQFHIMFTDKAERKSFALRIRKPAWSEKGLTIKVNGAPVAVNDEQGFLRLVRDWRSGDRITLELSPALYAEQLPDGKNYYSILFGPVVLASKIFVAGENSLSFVADDSRMGHVADGPVCPASQLPVIVGDPTDFLQGLHRQSGPLAFVADHHVAFADVKKRNASRKVELIPFFRLHDSRYQIYWPQLEPAGFNDYVAQLASDAMAREALAALIIDQVTPGQQQPEVEHQFKGENTRAGVNNGSHWRDATGWFSYALDNGAREAKKLRVRYFKGDSNRKFAIKVNDEIIAEVVLPATAKSSSEVSDFYEVDYPLSVTLQAAPTLTLVFIAREGSVAGGVYGIQLLR